MAERWDCIFVERIDSEGRIYLTNPQKYGHMYETQYGTCSTDSKVRKSIPKDCGPIKGASNESKILSATAIAVAYNIEEIKSSNGLIIRGFNGQTAFSGLQTALIELQGKTLRERGTTGWLVYVSPIEEFYHVDEKYIGEKLAPESTEKINGAITHIKNGWK